MFHRVDVICGNESVQEWCAHSLFCQTQSAWFLHGAFPSAGSGCTRSDRDADESPAGDDDAALRRPWQCDRGTETGPSCCPGAHRVRRGNAGEIQIRRGLRLRERDGARARGRLRLTWLPVACSAAPAAVDEQAVDGIWYPVQGRAYGRQAAKRLPLFLIVETDLEDHAPAVRVPRPVDRAIRQRRLDQGRVVLLLPPESRQLAVQYLNRPPLRHREDRTSFSRIGPGEVSCTVGDRPARTGRGIPVPRVPAARPCR